MKSGAWAYHDPEMALTSALGVQVMLTSVLYDAAGKERGASPATSTGPAPALPSF